MGLESEIAALRAHTSHRPYRALCRLSAFPSECKLTSVAGRRLEPVTQQKAAKTESPQQYRLTEVVAGGRVERAGKVFAFTGAPIPFDKDGIWPMIDDPNLVLYPKGSRAQILAKQFAESYQTLLSALNRTFNGSPGFLKQSIGLMYSLDLQARELMQTPSGIVDGATAGPSFQLPVPGM